MTGLCPVILLDNHTRNGGGLMTTVYLIRHSLKMREPVGGRSNVFTHMRPLSAEGEERAKKLLEIPELRNADFAYASSMSRSLATIRYLIESDNVPYEIDGRLSEISRPDNMSMPVFIELQKAGQPIPGGETWAECRKRMTEAIDDIVREHSGERILVGSHGAAMGLYFEGMGLGKFREINSPDIFRLEFDGGNLASFAHIDTGFPMPPRPERMK